MSIVSHTVAPNEPSHLRRTRATMRYSTQAMLVPAVDDLRIQVSRLDVEHSARKFVITDDDGGGGTAPPAYRVSGYPGGNPTLYVLAGLTYAFEIDTEHPVVITDTDVEETYVTWGMTYYNDESPVRYVGASANDGKRKGFIYWTIPPEVSAAFKYQNTEDPSMFGTIIVKSLFNIAPMEPTAQAPT